MEPRRPSRPAARIVLSRIPAAGSRAGYWRPRGHPRPPGNADQFGRGQAPVRRFSRRERSSDPGSFGALHPEIGSEPVRPDVRALGSLERCRHSDSCIVSPAVTKPACYQAWQFPPPHLLIAARTKGNRLAGRCRRRAQKPDVLVHYGRTPSRPELGTACKRFLASCCPSALRPG